MWQYIRTHIDAYSFKCVLQIVVAIYIAALVSQSSRFVELEFASVNETSRVDLTSYVTGCRVTLTSFIARHEKVGNLYSDRFLYSCPAASYLDAELAVAAT